MGDWSNLPGDVLRVIGDLLDAQIDYVRLSAVCGWWRKSLGKWPKRSYCPWLMLPCDDENENKLQGFYNLLNHRVYYLELLELRHRYCVGSSDGWLVTLEKGSLNLLNPLTKSQIQLPHFSTFPTVQDYNPSRRGKEYTILVNPTPIDNIHDLFPTFLSQNELSFYILKIALSFSTPNDFIAVAIHGDYGKLAFTKFGHRKWTYMPMPISFFRDCIFSNGKIYAINVLGDVVVSTIDTPTLLVTHFTKLITDVFWDCLYLVKTLDDDELLMVARIIDDPDDEEIHYLDQENNRDEEFELVDDEDNLREWRGSLSYPTNGFKLFKLDSNQNSWLPINNLDDRAIFLGLNTSICISSRDCPNLNTNHIYYSDDSQTLHTLDYRGGQCHDIGVLNVLDGSLRRILYEERPLRLLFWPQPIWVILDLHSLLWRQPNLVMLD